MSGPESRRVPSRRLRRRRGARTHAGSARPAWVRSRIGSDPGLSRSSRPGRRARQLARTLRWRLRRASEESVVPSGVRQQLPLPRMRIPAWLPGPSGRSSCGVTNPGCRQPCAVVARDGHDAADQPFPDLVVRFVQPGESPVRTARHASRPGCRGGCRSVSESAHVGRGPHRGRGPVLNPRENFQIVHGGKKGRLGTRASRIVGGWRRPQAVSHRRRMTAATSRQ